MYQIAAAAGATVISTSSSDEKLEIARKLGATHTINYRKTPDWSSKVLELTGGVGVDIVVEVVGGAGLIDSINSVRYDGRVGLIGLLDKEDGAVAITRPLLFGGKTSEWSDLFTTVCILTSCSSPSPPWCRQSTDGY